MLEKNIYEEMLKSEKDFKEHACKSSMAIRLNNELEDIRLEFARDIDKIVHSSCYTRYMSKTQVFIDSSNDHISTRMTHVQYVARAAKTIARALGLNEDLCEAIALGHDVGHTPYGHFGERVLNKLSLKYNEGKCFAHNLNSVRVFEVLEKKGNTTNLTLQVLDGIMCHNGELLQSKYMPRKNKSFEEFYNEYEECLRDEKAIKKLIPATLEGCVVRISDIIGYIGKDIDDAKRLGVFQPEMLPYNVKKYLGQENTQIMKNIIIDIIKNSYDKNYITMSEEVYKAIVDLKQFNYDHIYIKAIDSEDAKRYTKYFETLYDVYSKALESKDKSNDICAKFLANMSEEYLKNTSDSQKIIDFLSGMTDSFLERQYEKYK